MTPAANSPGPRFAPVRGRDVCVADRLILNVGGRWTLVTVLALDLPADGGVPVRLRFPTGMEGVAALAADAFYDREVARA